MSNPKSNRPNKSALKACKQVSKHNSGRDTLYKVAYNKQAYKLCLLGFTDKELANDFDVSESTINAWKLTYPLFLESIKRGKVMADAEIAESLFQRAKGFSVEKEKVFMHQGEIIRANQVDYYPPDIAAAKLWLTNRQPEKWRQKDKAEDNNTLDPETIVFLSGEFEDRLRKIREDAAKLREERGLTNNRDIMQGYKDSASIKSNSE